ncbi:MAG: SDR family oxidoreductase [Lentisphaerae bacterium]|nr:SDR family oxidoreductase [Lentisphaerota bacterium]
MQLASSMALVTGGAVRIGRAICTALASRGCGVLIHCSRSLREARLLARDLAAKGARVGIVQSKLDEPDDIERLAQAAFETAPGLNILVNNASIFNKESILQMTPRSLQREFQVNLFAPMLLTQAFARGLRQGNAPRAGKVINLVDRRIAGQEAGCTPYLLSKKALADFTTNAALELAPHITVNAVAPGAILPPPGKGAAAIRDLAGKAPLQHRCRPEDVAQAVVFLLEADGITGQTVFVDSGQHLLSGR